MRWGIMPKRRIISKGLQTISLFRMQRLSDSAFVAFDLETTGLSPESDSLLEIGAVRVTGGVLGEKFSVVVKPRSAIPSLARHLTGITPEEAEQGQEPAEAIKAFFAFAGDLPWVAHNAEFDITFLQAECTRAEIEWPTVRCYDSLTLSRMAWPTLPNHKLENLATSLNLPAGRSHRALPDAEWSALTFIKAEAELSARSADHPMWQALIPQLPEPWSHLADAVTSSTAEALIADSLWIPKPAARAPIAVYAEAPGEDFFKVGGPLDLATRSRVQPDAAWPQRWYADARRAVNEGKVASLECSDKRAGALLLAAAVTRALKADKPVLMVVADSRAEEALMGVALSEVREAFRAAGQPGDGFDVVVLREPDGYFSTQRLQYTLPRFSARFSAAERLQMLPVLAWARQTASGDLLSFPGVAADRSRTLGLKVAAAGFAPDEAFAHAALRAAEAAQVIVVRSETFLRDLELDGALIPPCDTVIFTDGQRLPEAIEMHLGREFHFFRLRHVLQWVGVSAEDTSGLTGWLAALQQDATARGIPFEPEAEAQVTALIGSLIEKTVAADKAGQKWLAKLGKQAEKRVKPGESRLRYREKLAIELNCPETPVHEAIEALQSDLAALATALESRRDAAFEPLRGEAQLLAQECRRCSSRLGEIRTLITRIASPHEGEVAWMEEFQNPHKMRLRLRALDAGKLFADKIAALHRGGLFVGGSLSLNDGNQKHFAQRVGLTHFEAAVRFGSEAPPAKERLTLLMPFAPAPQGADSAKNLAEMLGRMLKDLAEPVAIFAPSHTVVKALREGLMAQLPDRLVIAQGIDGQRDNLAFLFKQAANPILIGQDWPVELADASGKKPSLWVMARIPFAPPTDAMIAARGELAQQAGKHPLFDLLVPEAATRIKDLFQKHRRTGEKNVVWMTDPRLARERYGAFITRALTQDLKTCTAESDVLNETRAWLSGSHGQSSEQTS